MLYGAFIQYGRRQVSYQRSSGVSDSFTFAVLFFFCLSGREKRSNISSVSSHLVTYLVSSHPLLSSTSSAVIGCVLKRSPLLRVPPGPEGRYRLVRRRTPSYPGFTARSREDVARPASEQLARKKGEIKGHRAGRQADGGRARAGDRTLFRAACCSPSAAGGNFSADPLTRGCGAAALRVRRGRRRSPPHPACPGSPAWGGGGGGFYTAFLLIYRTFLRHF